MSNFTIAFLDMVLIIKGVLISEVTFYMRMAGIFETSSESVLIIEVIARGSTF